MYLEQRVEQLEKQVQELLKLVNEKKVNNISDAMFKFGSSLTKIHIPKLTNNALRKENIQEAKDFVKEMKKFITNDDGYDQKHPKYGLIKYVVYELAYDKVEFKVDVKTKTVTVELSYRGKVKFTASAKCMDSDVFNVHIGKAIALGRVLGLNVSRFENAVMPDEVVVGQLLEWEDKGDYGTTPLYEVLTINKNVENLIIKETISGQSELEGKLANGGDLKVNDWWQIVDDSNAKY